MEAALAAEETHMTIIDPIMGLLLIRNILLPRLIEVAEVRVKEDLIHHIHLEDIILDHFHHHMLLLHHQAMDPRLLILPRVVDITVEKLHYHHLSVRYTPRLPLQLLIRLDISHKSLLVCFLIQMHLPLLQQQQH